jgi:hypothetical protein
MVCGCGCTHDVGWEQAGSQQGSVSYLHVILEQVKRPECVGDQLDIHMPMQQQRQSWVVGHHSAFNDVRVVVRSGMQRHARKALVAEAFLSTKGLLINWHAMMNMLSPAPFAAARPVEGLRAQGSLPNLAHSSGPPLGATGLVCTH